MSKVYNKVFVEDFYGGHNLATWIMLIFTFLLMTYFGIRKWKIGV